MFSLISGRRVGAHSNGHQHGVSILSSIRLREMFRQMLRPETWECCLFSNLL